MQFKIRPVKTVQHLAFLAIVTVCLGTTPPLSKTMTMKNIQLEPFLTIEGVGSASGIVYHDNSLYIIGDNSGFLFQYNLIDHKKEYHALIENASTSIKKKRKPDFEAITLLRNDFHIFGSGSTHKRNKKIIFSLETNTPVAIDWSSIYEKLKEIAHFSDDDLNIEGALYIQDKLYLFQRGNGFAAKNGVFTIHDATIAFRPITLPKIEHIETSFTDAVLIENKIYFLAAAEDTISTYDDGKVLGTIMGVMNPETLEVEKSIQLSPTHKLEGLTLFEKNENQLTFLLCEDNDTEELNATIYKLKLNIEH